MKVNFGFFINKALRLIWRPALRDCRVDKTAWIGPGCNCIAMTMGRYSYMGRDNSVTSAHIGSFCSIASFCAIGGRPHSIDAVSSSPVFCRGRNVFGKNFGHGDPPPQEEVVIGNDVWIGEGAFIFGGVTIGDGAVIGAHSVVTQSVPPYAVVAGAPARLLRYRFDEDQISRLMDLKWWDWSEDELRRHGDRFADVGELLKIKEKDQPL